MSCTWEVTGTGPPLVLSHGAIESSRSWADVVAALEHNFTVVTYDARGRGQCQAPTSGFTYADLADDVQRLADRLRLGPLFHAGHSMGGRVAFEHAIANPASVRALAVISARAEPPGGSARDALRTLARDVRTHGAQAAAALWEAPGSTTYERARAISACNSVEGTVGALEALLAADSLLPRLCQIDCPTLCVAGERDGGYVAAAQTIAEVLPRARLRILQGVGHFPNLECPRLLAQELRSFFLVGE